MQASIESKGFFKKVSFDKYQRTEQKAKGKKHSKFVRQKRQYNLKDNL